MFDSQKSKKSIIPLFSFLFFSFFVSFLIFLLRALLFIISLSSSSPTARLLHRADTRVATASPLHPAILGDLVVQQPRAQRPCAWRSAARRPCARAPKGPARPRTWRPRVQALEALTRHAWTAAPVTARAAALPACVSLRSGADSTSTRWGPMGAGRSSIF